MGYLLAGPPRGGDHRKGGRVVAGSRKFYFRSVARRWAKAVEAAPQRVVLLSPYITAGAVKVVLGGKRPPQCWVYTLFRAELFASGASDLDVLKGLLGKGVHLFQLDKLHAKVLLVPG